MIGSIGLAIRIGLYALAGFLASQGLADFDQSAGEITFQLETIATWAGSVVSLVGTFLASRWVKARGGKT